MYVVYQRGTLFCGVSKHNTFLQGFHFDMKMIRYEIKPVGRILGDLQLFIQSAGRLTEMQSITSGQLYQIRSIRLHQINQITPDQSEHVKSIRSHRVNSITPDQTDHIGSIGSHQINHITSDQSNHIRIFKSERINQIHQLTSDQTRLHQINPIASHQFSLPLQMLFKIPTTSTKIKEFE